MSKWKPTGRAPYNKRYNYPVTMICNACGAGYEVHNYHDLANKHTCGSEECIAKRKGAARGGKYGEHRITPIQRKFLHHLELLGEQRDKLNQQLRNLEDEIEFYVQGARRANTAWSRISKALGYTAATSACTRYSGRVNPEKRMKKG